MPQQKKYRLVTRSDFDGLVCAMLLKEMNLIDDILFVQPKEMQDGKVPTTSRDITTNLPYVANVHLAFDHHASETIRLGLEKRANYINIPDSPSAARILFNHYGGTKAFPRIDPEIINQVDKADMAQFVDEEVLYPKGWVLMNFIMDPRTGLGRFHHFRISNYDLMMQLIDFCRDHPIDDILQLPDVKERVDLYFEQEEKFKTQIQLCTKIRDNLAIMDFRNEATLYAGNRFMVYALYPQCNISMHILWSPEKRTTVFAIGKSIFNRTSKTNVGALCLEYGGGGHSAAGTCQVEITKAVQWRKELVARILKDG